MGEFLFQWQLMTERCWRADRKGMGGFYEGQKGVEGEGMLPKTRTLLMRWGAVGARHYGSEKLLEARTNVVMIVNIERKKEKQGNDFTEGAGVRSRNER